MSAVLQPFGFRPAFHPSGSANPRTSYGSMPNTIAYNYATNQPVTIDVNGKWTPAANINVNPALNTVIPVKAIFAGLQYFDENGFVKERASIVAGTPLFNAANATNNGDAYASNTGPYVYMDPQMEFYVQANGPMSAASVGQTFDIDPSTIQTVNSGGGISGVVLDNTPVPGGVGNFVVTQLAKLPNNFWGDAYTVVQVKLNNTNL